MSRPYSVIVSTRDRQDPQLDWHRRLESDRTQLVIIENRGTTGLGAAYNQGLSQATGEFCCFIHDDVRVRTPGWLDRLAAVLTVDSFDLVGVAGSTRMPRTGGWWDAGKTFGRGGVTHLHSPGRQTRDDYGPADDPFRSISEVVTLDGLLLFGRRRDFLDEPFDEELFEGFHFYDSDLSLRWLLWKGKRLGVLHNLDVVHHAGASLKGWQPMLARFHYRHGGFLPLTLSDVRVWSENIAAMRAADAPAARRLTASRRPGTLLSYAFQSDGTVVGKAEQRDIPILESPPRDSNELFGSWIVIQGAGNGNTIDCCLRDDSRDILVIEPEAHLICWLLSRFHWAEAIHSGRLSFWIPPVDSPEIHEVSLHETIVAIQQQIELRGQPAWMAAGSALLHEDFHRTIHRCSTLSAEVGEKQSRWPAQKESSCGITIVSPRCPIFNDLANALTSLGCRTRLIEVPDRPADWTKTKILHAVRQLTDEATEVTLLRNRVLLEPTDPRLRMHVDRMLRGSVVSWWWDTPTFASKLDWSYGLTQRPALAFARELLAQLPSGSKWLPPAARTEFAECPTQEDDSRRDLFVTFVGQSRFVLMRNNLNILANALVYYSGRTGHRLADAINRATSMLGFYDALISLKEPIEEAISNVGKSFPPMGDYLQYLARMSTTAAFRLAAIQTIRDLPILVFGDKGWVESGAVPASKYGGVIAPQQLRDLYQRTRVNLNLNFMQVSSTVNPRVLDIAASGSTVLTDIRPELVELFPDPTARPFSFETIDELPELVSQLMVQRVTDTRRRICEHVRSHHTLRHRAEWIANEYKIPRHAG